MDDTEADTRAPPPVQPANPWEPRGSHHRENKDIDTRAPIEMGQPPLAADRSGEHLERLLTLRLDRPKSSAPVGGTEIFRWHLLESEGFPQGNSVL